MDAPWMHDDAGVRLGASMGYSNLNTVESAGNTRLRESSSSVPGAAR